MADVSKNANKHASKHASKPESKSNATKSQSKKPLKTVVDVVVIGAGPGGYAAAFYAADQGKKVVLVEKEALGGVCLNRGCIPSKAFLHAAKLIEETAGADHMGLTYGAPKIDPKKMTAWKDGIVKKLSDGVGALAKNKGVEVIKGKALFVSSTEIRVETDKGQHHVQFQNAILATGSRPAMPAAFDLGSKRVMTSTEALNIDEVPKTLLVIGGGYIGMELGTVYAALGSQVTIVEAADTILSGADSDLVRPVVQKAKSTMQAILLKTKVLGMKTKGNKIEVSLDENGTKRTQGFDKVLVSVGRTPNSQDIGLEKTRVSVDDKGFVKVNTRQQTDDPAIYAIGDIAGGLLLAHKASKEARIAVENIVGEGTEFKNIHIPAVVFTDPEIAWVGLTESEAKSKGLKVKVAKFPWGANGRSLTLNRPDGLTKLIIEPETERVLGVGIVGVGAGDLISEGALAIEMGATAQDIAETVHPHPTLSETMMEAAEVFYGHSTHVTR